MLVASCSSVFSVSASRPSSGLAAGVTDSVASTLAGLFADSGGGWKFVAQLLRSSEQNGATKTLMRVFMMMFFARRWWRFEAEFFMPNMTTGVRDVPSNTEVCAGKNERRHPH